MPPSSWGKKHSNKELSRALKEALLLQDSNILKWYRSPTWKTTATSCKNVKPCDTIFYKSKKECIWACRSWIRSTPSLASLNATDQCCQLSWVLGKTLSMLEDSRLRARSVEKWTLKLTRDQGDNVLWQHKTEDKGYVAIQIWSKPSSQALS